MNAFFYYAVGGTLIAAIGLLFAEYHQSQKGKWLFKPLASLGFIVAGFFAGGTLSSYGQVVLVAFFFCMLGDLLLIPTKTKSAFLGGLIAFLIGHIGFIVAFLVLGVNLTWAAIALLPLSASALLIYRWLQPDIPEKLKIPVLFYVVVITVMVILSVAVVPTSKNWLIPIAATAFWFSDISVAKGRFKQAGFGNKLWGSPLYFCAQLLFAYTISS